MIVDSWNKAESYEPYIGRWSRPIARDFVRWLDVQSGLRWLDVGCGTGALCETVLQQASPAEIVGIDRSAEYVRFAAAATRDPRLRVEAGDATALPVRDSEFDVVVSGLMLNFIPDPAIALGEMRRAVRFGGRVAAYVWDYAEGMQMLRHFWDAAGLLDPQSAALDEGSRFPVCRPDALASLFRENAFSDVEVTPLEAPTVFQDFADYWQPFLGGQGPAPSYVRSLPHSERARLEEALRQKLPIGPNGAIHLSARAWAVKGTKH